MWWNRRWMSACGRPLPWSTTGSATSAASRLRPPAAIASAACAVTTGPGGTPSSWCLMSLTYATTAPRNHLLAPGAAASLLASMPPVSDSATTTVRPDESSTSAILSTSALSVTALPERRVGDHCSPLAHGLGLANSAVTVGLVLRLGVDLRAEQDDVAAEEKPQ